MAEIQAGDRVVQKSTGRRGEVEEVDSWGRWSMVRFWDLEHGTESVEVKDLAKEDPADASRGGFVPE